MISGLGPTILISPFNTFKNWGNSSKLYVRLNFPILYIYIESRALTGELGGFGSKLDNVERYTWIVGRKGHEVGR